MFIKAKSRRGTTLIELLITITIFSIVAIISATALMNTMQSTKRIQSQVFLYAEAQTLMDQLARAVEQNTVDYETYYSRTVQGEFGWHTDNYGYYGQSFFDPGTGGPIDDGPYVGIEDYGVDCVGVPGGVYPEDCPGETPVQSQGDLNTGQHPFDGISIYPGYATDEEKMNAFCEDEDNAGNCDGYDYYFTDELILINGAGDERTVFAREEFPETSEADYYMSKIQFTGEDTDNDGVVDDWACVEPDLCTTTDNEGNAVPRQRDLTNNNEDPQMDLMPITPSTVSIDAFHVIVAPNEDPYRAFAEAEVQIQPQVTMIMTVTLSEDYGSVLGEALSITIQRTVSTGVYSEVTSYE
jgi:prepilin-type N-terminal cleavage/methylation domain-containing protein